MMLSYVSNKVHGDDGFVPSVLLQSRPLYTNAFDLSNRQVCTYTLATWRVSHAAYLSETPEINPIFDVVYFFYYCQCLCTVAYNIWVLLQGFLFFAMALSIYFDVWVSFASIVQNNAKFSDYVERVFPIKLETKDTTETVKTVYDLQLYLEINNEGTLITKLQKMWQELYFYKFIPDFGISQSLYIKKKMWYECQWDNSPQETEWHRN